MPQPPNEDPNMSPLQLPNPAQDPPTTSQLARMPTLLLNSQPSTLRRYNAVRIEPQVNNVPEEFDKEEDNPEGSSWWGFR